MLRGGCGLDWTLPRTSHVSRPDFGTPSQTHRVAPDICRADYFHLVSTTVLGSNTVRESLLQDRAYRLAEEKLKRVCRSSILMHYDPNSRRAYCQRPHARAMQACRKVLTGHMMPGTGHVQYECVR
jgi:hypothetical protein